eukprot:scaffold126434_cov57-Phaeocystis_antarctica.AAC.2
MSFEHAPPGSLELEHARHDVDGGLLARLARELLGPLVVLDRLRQHGREQRRVLQHELVSEQQRVRLRPDDELDGTAHPPLELVGHARGVEVRDGRGHRVLPPLPRRGRRGRAGGGGGGGVGGLEVGGVLAELGLGVGREASLEDVLPHEEGPAADGGR